jgi:superfamily II DNA or RNA helicase
MEHQERIAEIKSGVQEAGFLKWVANFMKGTVVFATGVGKSKLAIDAILYVLQEKPSARILLVVPTEALRDENWPAEISKWVSADQLELVNTQLEIICYASIPKYQSQIYDLLILDEVHHITERSEQIITGNVVRRVLGLSATPPDEKRDFDKHRIIQKYCPVVFSYNLDQGVDDGIVADFEIVVVMEPLDNINKTIVGGTKKKPFLTTEANQYKYLDQLCKRTMSMTAGPNKENAVKFSLLKRTRFIYNLPSKTKLVKEILSHFDEHTRILTFCGGIEQSRELFGEDVYNSKDKKNDKLNALKEGKINRIGVVDAVDEGHNIPGMDVAILAKITSNERQIVQRIGRIVRIRPNHKGLIFILCSIGTQDESWIKKALQDFDPQKITYIPSREIYTGEFFKNR